MKLKLAVLSCFFLVYLTCSFVSANEVDYFCIFSSQATAQVDSAISPYWNGTTWDQSQTFPGISVTTPQALVNGISSLAGFWIEIASAGPNAALDADVACVLKLDRDVAAVNGAFVLGAAITGGNRTSLTFKPVPAGSAYPRPLGK